MDTDARASIYPWLRDHWLGDGELGRHDEDDVVQRYLYYFTHVPTGAATSYHTAEVSYVFNNERGIPPRYSPNMPAVSPSDTDRALAEAMSDYWVEFARSGVPAAKGQPTWQPYALDRQEHFMEFTGGRAMPGERFYPDMQHKPICQVLR